MVEDGGGGPGEGWVVRWNISRWEERVCIWMVKACFEFSRRGQMGVGREGMLILYEGFVFAWDYYDTLLLSRYPSVPDGLVG